MFVDTVELTISHVDLGTLTETTFVTLCGDAHAHRITRGTGNCIDDITDVHERRLYPGHFSTHLKVPASRPLESFRLWDRISIATEVRSYGGMILDSTYILGFENELANVADSGELEQLPTMHGGVMFMVDEGHVEEPHAAVPKTGMLADLPKSTSPPKSFDSFAQVQSQGSVDPDFAGAIRGTEPVPYQLVTGRDAAKGKALMFATFVRLMDYAERVVLEQHVRPPFARRVIDSATVIERETYYLGNCYAGDVILIDVRAGLENCPSDFHRGARQLVSAGILTVVLELYSQRCNALLLASRARKLLLIPAADKRTLKEAERVLFHYGDRCDG
jgi:probable biosynthetic protein (TIGR04098 family)